MQVLVDFYFYIYIRMYASFLFFHKYDLCEQQKYSQYQTLVFVKMAEF